MDGNARAQFTRIKLASDHKVPTLEGGPCDLEVMYRLENARGLVDKDTFNPVVSIEKRILNALLPEGCHQRIPQSSKNSMLHKVWGRWAALVEHWRMRGRNNVEMCRPYPSAVQDMKCVAVKIRMLLDPEHELLCISEDMCHQTATVMGVPCPAFVFGTTIVFRDYGTVRVTVMQYMDGFVPLGDTISALSPDARARLEGAIVGMWEAGIAHCDLHEENVLIPAERGADPTSFCIVDFGFSLMLRGDEVRSLRRAICSGNSPADAFDAVLLDTLVKVQSMRRLPFFHCDSRFLRMLHQLGTESQRDTDKKVEGVKRVESDPPKKRAYTRKPKLTAADGESQPDAGSGSTQKKAQ